MFGYGSSDWAGGPSVRINAIASENNGQTSNRGADIKFETVATGGTSLQERLRITSDGIVGIGTNNPAANTKLEVIGALQVKNLSSSDSAKIILRDDSGSYNYYQIRNQDGSFYIRNSSQGRNDISVLSTGKVGIATDDPQSLLEVFGTSPIIRSKHSTSQKYTQINHNGTDGYVDWSSGGLIFRGASNAERLRITSGGDVGIGTDNPISDLHLFRTGDTTLIIESDRPNSDENANPKIVLKQDGGVNASAIGMNFDSDNIGNDLFIANSIASGSIRFLTGSTNGYTNASEALRITSDGKLLIGSDTGSVHGNRLLQIGKTDRSETYVSIVSSTSGESGLLFADTTTNDTGGYRGQIRYHHSDDSMNFKTGADERVRITSGGNIGIGETSPDVRLHVKEQFDIAYSLANVANEANHLLKLENPSTTANAFSGMQFRVGSGADMFFGAIQQSVNHGDFFFANQNSPQREMMRITSTGSVGIGTDNPSAQSTSANNLVIADFAGEGGITIKSNVNSAGNIFFADTAGTATGRIAYGHGVTDAGDYMRFYVNSEERLRIKHDGSVGIGTNNPNRLLHLKKSSGGGMLTIERTDSNSSALVIAADPDEISLFARDSDTGSTAVPFVIKQGGSTEALRITSSGDVGIGTATPDKKLRVEGDARVTGTLTIGEASTVIDGSVEYPTIRPTLDLNFAGTKVLDDRIAFTRDGVGTYVDDMGIIKYTSNNTPRFDHDPDTRESLGLLIEESRTNLLTYSDLVSGEGLGTGWAIGGSRASKGSNATAPDGTLSAWKSVYNGTGGDASLYKVGGEVTTSNSTEHTLSIFAKVPSTNTYITGVRIRTFNNNHSATFNLLTGTIVGGVEGTTTRRMEAYPNGWYRCSITFTSGTDGNQGVQYYMTDSSNSTSLNDSNANGEEIHYWGAQLEEGSFPTSYIPTSSAAVTRGQDFAIIKGTNFTDIFDTSFKQFSLLVDYDNTKTVDGTTYSIIDLWGESTGYDDRIEWFKDDQSPYHIETRAFGQGNATFTNGNLSASSKAKAQRFATSWYVPDYSNTSSRRFVVSMGGEAVDVINDASGTTVPQLTRMGIGCNPTRLDFSAGLAHFKKVVVYNKTLPDAQLQGLTQQ